MRDALRARFGLAESQVRVLEEAATAVAQERRQRQELERLNLSLRQLEAHKDQLTQMIVHDLKNPLTALIGFLQILRLDHLNVNQGDLLQNALRSSRNLSDLIGDLLDIGRIEEGRLELARVELSPHDLLMECANEMRGWLAQEGKTITVEVPGDLAVERQDTECRKSAVRQADLLPGDRDLDPDLGNWYRQGRVRSFEAALPPHHHND